MNRIKKGDQVVVTTGNKKIKGQTGEVLRVDGERVFVSNLNLVKRATKPNPQAGQAGGLIEREASIHISNVMLLNPATGDTERRRRPTLDRCIVRSKDLAATGLVIVNLFAFRHTDPKQLRTASDPVGPANDDVLREITGAGARTLVAWGGHGGLHGRSSAVGPLLAAPTCLGVTASGEPRHPLYVSSDAQLVSWTSPA